MPSSPPSSRSPQVQRTLELFRDWKAGDAAAGDALFRALQVRLRVYFRGHPTVLDDLVQETLVACVLARESLRCEDALLGYVYAVARRVLAHHLEYSARPIVAFAEEQATEQRAATPDHLLEARRLLQAHPTQCTRLVVSRYVEGHRGVEIARQLGISEASVRRRLRRGIDQLRRSATTIACS